MMEFGLHKVSRIWLVPKGTAVVSAPTFLRLSSNNYN